MWVVVFCSAIYLLYFVSFLGETAEQRRRSYLQTGHPYANRSDDQQVRGQKPLQLGDATALQGQIWLFIKNRIESSGTTSTLPGAKSKQSQELQKILYIYFFASEK